ncbi:hypothetical protein F5B21DRAFT_507100 [Xylaria acuta]|nr:hypothetical protein F5B21DRAFT_507100 [Xylaria acuta]
MDGSGYIPILNCSSNTSVSDAATARPSTPSEGKASSRSQQPNKNKVGKKSITGHRKLSPDTLKSLRSRLLDSLNILEGVCNIDEENSSPPTVRGATEVSNPFRSPLESGSITSDKPVSSTVSYLSFNAGSNETCEVIKIFRPLSYELEQVILPQQCALIEQHVKKGLHLAALSQALRFSCDFTFEGNRKDIFTAGIHTFAAGEEDEAPGVELWFKKKLSLDLRKYIARRLLRGLLVRYPVKSFPRTFWVAQGDELAEHPVILFINDAVGTDNDVYELDWKIHDILVEQWWDDYMNGSKIAMVR